MIKLKNKYEEYKIHEGTFNKGELITDRAQAEDSEIYSCIEKYGIQSLVRKTLADEPLYLDNTKEMTLQEAVQMRNQMDDYFKQMPARARKIFGDNPEIFYQKYKNGEYDEFIQTGALSQEQLLTLGGIKNESSELDKNINSNSKINTDDSKINIRPMENVE